MSQPPNYVVRQETGGKLKLLLVRDPRATEVATKLSPVKKQPAVSLVSSVPPTTTTSSHVIMDATPKIQTNPSKTKIADAHSALPTTQQSTSTVLKSPTTVFLKPNTSSSAVTGSESGKSVIVVRGGGGGGGGGERVKDGKVVKPHSKTPPAGQKTSSKVDSTASSSGGRRGVRTQQSTILSVSRVRNIMRTDLHTSQMTNSISQDSVAVVAKATELFIAQLIRGAHKIGMAGGERNVGYRHLSLAVREEKKTEFLHDILPQKVVVRDFLASLGNQADHTPSNTTSS